MDDVEWNAVLFELDVLGVVVVHEGRFTEEQWLVLLLAVPAHATRSLTEGALRTELEGRQVDLANYIFSGFRLGDGQARLIVLEVQILRELFFALDERVLVRQVYVQSVVVRLFQLVDVVRLLVRPKWTVLIVVDDAILFEEGMHTHHCVHVTLQMSSACGSRQVHRRISSVQLNYEVAVFHVDARSFAGIFAAEKLWKRLLLDTSHLRLVFDGIKPRVNCTGRYEKLELLTGFSRVVRQTGHSVRLLHNDILFIIECLAVVHGRI